MSFKHRCIKCQKVFYTNRRSSRRCPKCYKNWQKYKRAVDKRIRKNKNIGWGWW